MPSWASLVCAASTNAPNCVVRYHDYPQTYHTIGNTRRHGKIKKFESTVFFRPILKSTNRLALRPYSFESELGLLSNEYDLSARRFVNFKMGLKNTVYKCSDANTYVDKLRLMHILITP